MEGKNGTIDKTDKKEKRTDTKIRRGRRRCRCCGDHSDSGSSDAVCKLDPDADDRGDPLHGCIQHVPVENLQTSGGDSSKERYYRAPV